MKLTSMTKFVLDQKKKWIDSKSDIRSVTALRKIFKYTDFLEQPLSIGMFVPCDLEGNVLDVPPQWMESWEFKKKQEVSRANEQYIQAKERVLFEGIKSVEWNELNPEIELIDDTVVTIFASNIEDLMVFGEWELTKLAINQIEG